MIYPHTFEEKIGMTEIRGLLNGHCLSTLGQQRVQEMSFLTDGAQLRELHQQVGELAHLLEEGDGFPEQGYYDLRPTLHRIRIEGTFIEVDEMFQLKRSLETIEAIQTKLRPTPLPLPVREESDYLTSAGGKGKDDSTVPTDDVPYPALSRMVSVRLSDGNDSPPSQGGVKGWV